MFHAMWKHPVSKYFGAFGIFIPFAVAVYYLFIMAWCLGYAWFSATGRYFGLANQEAMSSFLKGFQGVESNQFFSSLIPALIFLAICLAMNYLFISRGISKGIELLAKYGMPLLFLFGIILVIRVLTLGTPDPSHPEMEHCQRHGLYVEPGLQSTNPGVGLAGSGRADLFHPEPGPGDDPDLCLVRPGERGHHPERTGDILGERVRRSHFGRHDRHPRWPSLSSVSAQTEVIARGGAFDLGFVSLPLIFQKIPLGQLFGALWFLLLFIAGITTSVAFLQPLVAFLTEEFKMTRKKAVNTIFGFLVAAIMFVVFFFKFGVLDEFDFWIGTFGIVVFGALEIIIFSWVFGIKKGWDEMHKGADFKIPRVFKFIMKYITPAYMLIILGVWTYQDAIGKFLMKGEPAERHPYLWGARVLIALIILTVCLLVHKAWKKKR